MAVLGAAQQATPPTDASLHAVTRELVDDGLLSWDSIEDALTSTFQALADASWARALLSRHVELLASLAAHIPASARSARPAAPGDDAAPADASAIIDGLVAIWLEHAARLDALPRTDMALLVAEVVGLAAAAARTAPLHDDVSPNDWARHVGILVHALMDILFDGAVSLVGPGPGAEAPDGALPPLVTHGIVSSVSRGDGVAPCLVAIGPGESHAAAAALVDALAAVSPSLADSYVDAPILAFAVSATGAIAGSAPLPAGQEPSSTNA